ncbi:YqcC family protein [Thiolapillus sp.]
MNTDYQELSRYLQRLEKELRLLGWWSNTEPDADALQSTAPFCHDRMTLDQWLQWILIPGFQKLIDTGAPLPESCAIAPMAEIAWREEPPESLAALMQLLTDIDTLINHT